MRNIIIFNCSLLGVAHALVASGGTCTFTLTTSGDSSATNTVGQYPDGQNRVGYVDLDDGVFTMDSAGGIYDSHGRGCILTPATTQFQCDAGAPPTNQFSLGCDGTLYYQGNPHFVACHSGGNGDNIYSTSSAAETGCVPITLTASGCFTPCTPPPPPPASASPSPQPQCGSLSKDFEFPHLIIPISRSQPTTAQGQSYAGQISADISTIFAFDIPQADAPRTCSLVFLFPQAAQLHTASFRLAGDGRVSIARLAPGGRPLDNQTTWANAPAPSTQEDDQPQGEVYVLAPATDYGIATFPCPAGQRIAFRMANAGSTDLAWFQDYNPCPIGLYINVS